MNLEVLVLWMYSINCVLLAKTRCGCSRIKTKLNYSFVAKLKDWSRVVLALKIKNEAEINTIRLMWSNGYLQSIK